MSSPIDTAPMGPLRVAVVGHVNTGKSSLISTLSRRSDLAVGDGRTSLALQEVTFECGGEEVLVLVDTPGFEMAGDVLADLDRAKGEHREAGQRPEDEELVLAFVEREGASVRGELALDVRALRAALGADVVLYVVDVTQEPLERLRDEVELLARTARPVVGVLNFTAESGSHTPAWREVLRRAKVHAVVSFDVMVHDAEAETELYRAMESVVMSERREAVGRLRDARAGEEAVRRHAAVREAARLLLDVMTLQVLAPVDDPDAEANARLELARLAAQREREGLAALGRAHGFAGTEIAVRTEGLDAEVLRADLFDPEALRRYGPSVLLHAAGGAGAGVALDLLLGGGALGLVALVGGALGLVGGIVRSGMDVSRRGEHVVARPPVALAWLLLARVVTAEEVYRRRTHARRDVETVGAGARSERLRQQAAAHAAVALLARARNDVSVVEFVSPRLRAEAVAALERELARLF